MTLKFARIKTPLGPVVAAGDEKALYFLEFEGESPFKLRLKQKTGREVVEGQSASIRSIQKELRDYFEGRLKEFKTPVILSGSPFQKRVWKELMRIPYGETRSYAELAEAMGKPTAYRAVAQANGANLISIVIPCHRVINKSGALGGYSGGLEKKKKLLQLEG